MSNEINILGARVNLVQMPEVLEKMEEWIEHKKKACFVIDVKNIIISRTNQRYTDITNSAGLLHKIVCHFFRSLVTRVHSLSQKSMWS